MALIDVLKYDGPNNVLVWKWRPKNDGKRQEELRIGTQLVVNQAQQAVFVKGGQIADIFDEGTHTLSTANLPVISNIIGLAFGGQSPFKAEVYFFNKAVAMDNKFGLIPFNMIEPNFRVPIPITSRGSFAVKILDVRTFLSQIIGTVPDFEAITLRNYFRGVITEQIKAAIIRISKEQNISPLELEAIVFDVSSAVKGIISETLAKYGLYLEMFNIEAIPIVDEDERVKKVVADYQRLMSQDMEERLRLKRRAENLEIYKVERSFDTTEAAASNIGGGDDGAGSILGTMVGLGMVNPLAQTMGNMMQNIAPNVAQQQTAQMSKDEVVKLLKDLGELKAAGILTEDEFAEKKKELLSKI
jgi:membrane protease subunit (stomatin/prohibitin family)